LPRLFRSLFWYWLIEFRNIALIGFFVAVINCFCRVLFFFFSSDFRLIFMMLRTELFLKAPIDNLRAVLWIGSNFLIVAEVAPAYSREPYSSAERIIELCIRCNFLLFAPHLRLLSIFIIFNFVLASFFILAMCVRHVSFESKVFWYWILDLCLCFHFEEMGIVGDVFFWENNELWFDWKESRTWGFTP